MLLVALALSTFFAFCVCQGVRTGSRREYATSCAIAGAGVIAGLMCMQSPLLMLNAFLVAVATVLCSIFAVRVRTFRISVIAATLATYLIVGVVFVLPEVREVSKKRDGHPLESMADRLPYEKGSRQRQPLPGPALERLALLEGQIGNNESSRVAELREIHQSYVTYFVNSPGFGVVRIIGKNANSAFGTVGASIGAVTGTGGGSPVASAPSDGASKLPLDYEDPSHLPGFRDPWEQKNTTTIPSKDTFLAMHRDGLVDFVNKDGFGYIEDRKNVAGFWPHGFSRVPSLDRSASGDRWEIGALDLISLLKHEEPVAYVSDNLPRMKKLRTAPIRPLDDLEKKMLVELERGEDLQLLISKDRIRMLGSIRAGKQCVRCHNVERGDLLGAFAYKLRRQ